MASLEVITGFTLPLDVKMANDAEGVWARCPLTRGEEVGYVS